MTTEKKVTIVTGASKGIGAGIAKALAAESYAVVVNYASSKTDADRVVGEIERAGGKALAIHADVSKQAEVKKLFRETLKAFGHRMSLGRKISASTRFCQEWSTPRALALWGDMVAKPNKSGSRERHLVARDILKTSRLLRCS